MEKKKFKVKEEHFRNYGLLLQHAPTSSYLERGSESYEILVKAEVLDRWCEELPPEMEAERKSILAASDHGNLEEFKAQVEATAKHFEAVPVLEDRALRGNKWPQVGDADSEMIKMGYKISGGVDMAARQGAFKWEFGDLVIGKPDPDSEPDGIHFTGKEYAEACGVDVASLPLQAWKEPEFYLSVGAQRETYIKAKLLVRMQSWADYQNKLDGFVADWRNNHYKWGIDIKNGTAEVDRNTFLNTGLFQISVSSEERACSMLTYFSTEIAELIKLRII